MQTLQTDDHTYEDLGFNKFLTRKSDKLKETILEDNSSSNIEQLSGNIDAVVKFIRVGIEKDKPITGEKEGSIYYATNTKKLWIWDGSYWYSVVLS